MRMNQKLSNEQRIEAVERYLAGETPKQIGDSYGVSGPNISYLVRKAGVARRLRPGVAPGSPRFGQSDRRAIARSFGDGVSAADLSREWGICDTTVYKYAAEFGISAPARPTSRDTYLRETYDITLEDYDALLRRQHGRCAICGRIPQKMRLAVDHDHETGGVRGLLCQRCNTGIGHLGDDPERCDRAAAYLRADGQTDS